MLMPMLVLPTMEMGCTSGPLSAPGSREAGVRTKHVVLYIADVVEHNILILLLSPAP